MGVCMMTMNRTSFPQSAQPCWDCVNACGGCAWSREGKPVPGWEAEQTSILCCTGRQAVRTESYKINFCPEFRRG